jgi:lipid A 3-O-deacylase
MPMVRGEETQPDRTQTLAVPATEPVTKDFRQLYLFRFEFDNDSFIGSDDSFTAGWSLQLHSPMNDEWSPAFAKWIGRFPSLGDDGAGGRITRWAAGIGQIIITPTDITIEEPQPTEAPWAGILTAAMSWTANDNRRMGALQLLAGCMGPCSGAEAVQKFVHEDLGFGEPPAGWDNQLATKALFNANYEYRHKLFVDQAAHYFTPGHFAQDLSAGGQTGLGNLATYVAAELEYRLGWGLPMGFTKTADPAGIGIMYDPVYVDPQMALPAEVSAWRTYFTLMGRYAYITHLAPADGGPTENGGNHPPLDNYPGQRQLLVGFHLARVPFAFHLTYYRYFAQDRVGTDGSTDWVNLSFEYRF